MFAGLLNRPPVCPAFSRHPTASPPATKLNSAWSVPVSDVVRFRESDRLSFRGSGIAGYLHCHTITATSNCEQRVSVEGLPSYGNVTMILRVMAMTAVVVVVVVVEASVKVMLSVHHGSALATRATGTPTPPLRS